MKIFSYEIVLPRLLVFRGYGFQFGKFWINIWVTIMQIQSNGMSSNGLKFELKYIFFEKNYLWFFEDGKILVGKV